MGYGAFYVICPRASSQYATPLTLFSSLLWFFVAIVVLEVNFT